MKFGKRLILVVIVLLYLMSLGVTSVFAAAQLSGKQIVLIIKDVGIKFTSVSIQGNNQRNEWVTWSKQDSNGFTVAYTKDWWWTENFVQITFTIKDSTGKEESKHCLFDALAQPADSQSVVIVYSVGNGCMGGEAGSVQSLNSIQNAFSIIDRYLPDDKLDFFIKLIYNEVNAYGCVMGVSSIYYTQGLTVLNSTSREYIMKTCQTTFQNVLTLFPSQ